MFSHFAPFYQRVPNTEAVTRTNFLGSGEMLNTDRLYGPTDRRSKGKIEYQLSVIPEKELERACGIHPEDVFLTGVHLVPIKDHPDSVGLGESVLQFFYVAYHLGASVAIDQFPFLPQRKVI